MNDISRTTDPLDVHPLDIYPLGALRNLLKATCANAGGIRAWARKNDISPSFVSNAIRGKRLPGDKLLDALGLEASTVYVPKQQRRRS